MAQGEAAGQGAMVQDVEAGLGDMVQDEGAGLIVVVEDEEAGLIAVREDEEHQDGHREGAKTKTVTDIGNSYQDGHKAGDKTHQDKPKEQESTKDTGGYKRPMAEQDKRNEGSQGGGREVRGRGSGARRDGEGQGREPRPRHQGHRQQLLLPSGRSQTGGGPRH